MAKIRITATIVGRARRAFAGMTQAQLLEAFVPSTAAGRRWVARVRKRAEARRLEEARVVAAAWGTAPGGRGYAERDEAKAHGVPTKSFAADLKRKLKLKKAMTSAMTSAEPAARRRRDRVELIRKLRRRVERVRAAFSDAKVECAKAAFDGTLREAKARVAPGRLAAARKALRLEALAQRSGVSGVLRDDIRELAKEARRVVRRLGRPMERSRSGAGDESERTVDRGLGLGNNTSRLPAGTAESNLTRVERALAKELRRKEGADAGSGEISKALKDSEQARGTLGIDRPDGMRPGTAYEGDDADEGGADTDASRDACSFCGESGCDCQERVGCSCSACERKVRDRLARRLEAQESLDWQDVGMDADKADDAGGDEDDPDDEPDADADIEGDEQSDPPFTKEFVNYRYAADQTRRCGECRNFREPAACAIVLGKIRKVDTCDRFEPKEGDDDEADERD